MRQKNTPKNFGSLKKSYIFAPAIKKQWRDVRRLPLLAVFFCFLPQLVASDAIGCPPFKKIDHIGAVRKNTRQQKWKAKDFCTMASKLSFQTDINSIHPLCSSFEVECNDITLPDIRNNIVHVKEILFRPRQVTDKPEPFCLIKIVYPAP